MKSPSHLAIALALAACTASPQQPEYFLPAALSLPVHLADAPAPGEARPYLSVALDPIAYCSPGAPDAGKGFEPGKGGSATLVPFEPGASVQQIRFTGSGGAGLACGGSGLPGVRFFRPSALLQGPPYAVGTWVAHGRHIAWSQWPSTLALFGPEGPKVSLPVGYSALRTGCQNGRLVPTVEALDRVIELDRAGRGVELTGRAGLEREQRDLLAGCGLTPPALDPGTRVGLDAPDTLRWSPDGVRLYYLMGQATISGEAITSLRSVPVNGGAATELAEGLMAHMLLVPASGDVYVMDTQPGLLRGRPQPDGSLQLQAIPDPFRLVSPDGRWIAGEPPSKQGSRVVIYDVMTGQSRDVDAGWPIAWSPDSKRLAYQQQSDAGADPTVNLWSPETGQVAALGPGWRVQWLPGGELILGVLNPRTDATDQNRPPTETIRVLGPGEAPLGQFHFADPSGPHAWVSNRLVRLAGVPWSLQTIGAMIGVSALAGLELEDPTAGTRRTVIPTDRMLAQQLENATLVLAEGVVLAWVQQCLGFYQTACTHQLHRLSLADGGDQIVAVTAGLTAFALSPDQRRVAIGTRAGIFVKDLP
jgi:hypothetical protein